MTTVRVIARLISPGGLRLVADRGALLETRLFRGGIVGRRRSLLVLELTSTDLVVRTHVLLGDHHLSTVFGVEGNGRDRSLVGDLSAGRIMVRVVARFFLPGGVHVHRFPPDRGSRRFVRNSGPGIAQVRGEEISVKAVVWHGRRDVRVDNVPEPRILEPLDAIVRVTTSGLCGSDLHLYDVFAPYMTEGDILGHEPIGVVEEVGSEVHDLSVGDRVVVPFNISCGSCFMCGIGLQSQCETTQVTEYGTGAALFGYTKLYGAVAGGQAEYVRVPHADYGPIVVPEGPSDDRFVYLSDVLPTAWQAVAYAGVPTAGSIAVIGLGPIGEMCARIAMHLGAHTVIGLDLVPERLERARRLGVSVFDVESSDQSMLVDAVRDLTGGRGPDAVIDAVGLEAHGSPGAALAHRMTAILPQSIAERVMNRAAVDRTAALQLGIDLVRRGGTLSVTGVYGGMTDPLPMRTMFDKQVTVRMGQANVRSWTDDLLPLLIDEDVLGVESFATHHLPLAAASRAYEMSDQRTEGVGKVLFEMGGRPAHPHVARGGTSIDDTAGSPADSDVLEPNLSDSL